MARTATQGGSYGLLSPASFTFTYPFTMACWFTYPNTSTGGQGLMGMGDSSSQNQYWSLDVSNGAIELRSRSGGSQRAVSSNFFTANTWAHACGRGRSATDREITLNGDHPESGTNTVSSSPSNVDRVGLGNPGDSTPASLTCSFAHAAIWDVALTDDEVTMLAKGASPLLVRPQNLVFYAPCNIPGDTVDRCIVSGVALTENTDGSGTDASRPPVRMPAMQALRFPPSGGGITHEGALSFGVDAGVTLAADGVLEGSLSEGVNAGVTLGADAAFEAAIAQAVQAGATLTSDATFETAITQALQVAAALQAGSVQEAALTQALQLAAAFASDVTVEVDVSEALQVTAGLGADATFETAILQGLTLSSAFAADATLEAAIAFAVNYAFSTETGSVVEAALTETANLGVALLGGLLSEAAITEGFTIADTFAGDVTLEAALTESAQYGMTAAVELIAEAALAEGLVQDAIAAVQADLEAQLNQGVSVGATSTAEGILESGVSFSVSITVDADGAAAGTIEVAPPDGQTFTVPIENRTFRVPPDGRG